MTHDRLCGLVTRDLETGYLTVIEGPVAFTIWREADEASRFLRIDGEATA